MKKTYTIKELSIILDTKEHNIYNWFRYAVPEGLKPKKGWNEEVKRETYIFGEKDLDILIEIKDFKSDGFTYKEIKEELTIQMDSESDFNLLLEKNKEPIFTKSEIINTNDFKEYVELQESKDLRIMPLVLLIITLIVNLLILYKVF